MASKKFETLETFLIESRKAQLLQLFEGENWRFDKKKTTLWTRVSDKVEADRKAALIKRYFQIEVTPRQEKGKESYVIYIGREIFLKMKRPSPSFPSTSSQQRATAQK